MTTLLGALSILLIMAATIRTGPTGMVAVVAVAAVASTGAARWWLAVRAPAAERYRHRVLLVGGGSATRHLAREAERHGWLVLESLEQRAVGAKGGVSRLVRELGADRVIVADSPASAWPLMEELECDGAACDVYVVPGPYELALCPPSTERVGDVALFRLRSPRAGKGYEVAKRALDVVASLALLLLLAPVLLPAMLAIRLGSPGPVLFSQERVGRDGRRFRMVKLRTMVQDAEKEGPRLCSGKCDPRLTPTGRLLRYTHLDEVPQLWNVLRGEMSLVGPRPERPCFVEEFERELPEYSARHRIRPGITGLAQVCGSYHSSPREKLRYDLMYLYHRSPGMDLGILLRTALTLFG